MNALRKTDGFTIVELMIVAGIIALLASVAIPGFLRARVFSQATSILNDARVLESAVQQYLIETSTPPADAPTTFASYQSHLKESSRLLISNGCDIFGRPYTINDDGSARVKIDPSSVASLVASGVVDANFFQGYH